MSIFNIPCHCRHDYLHFTAISKLFQFPQSIHSTGKLKKSYQNPCIIDHWIPSAKKENKMILPRSWQRVNLVAIKADMRLLGRNKKPHDTAASLVAHYARIHGSHSNKSVGLKSTWNHLKIVPDATTCQSKMLPSSSHSLTPTHLLACRAANSSRVQSEIITSIPEMES